MIALILLSLTLNISLNELKAVNGILPVKKDLPFYMGKKFLGENISYRIKEFRPVDSTIIQDTFNIFEGPFPLSGKISKIQRIKEYPILNVKIEKERNSFYISFLLYPYKFKDGKIIKYTSFRLKLIPETKTLEIPYYPEKIDCIVITKKRNFDILKEYVKFREKFGYKILLFDVDSIVRNSEGSDPPEKIRNFIKNLYQVNGIEYVFLVGDINEIPIRYAYEGSFWYHDFVPTILYYSDLDGTWDADRDGIYGERNSDSLDAYPDVIVGWLPVSDRNLIQKYINRLKEYESHGTGHLAGGNFLFVGSSIAYQNDGYGPRILEWIKDSAFTVNQNIYRLYYPDSGNMYGIEWRGDEELSKVNFLNQIISSRYSFIIHFDHGSYLLLGTGWLKNEIINVFEINNFYSQSPFFFLSPACDVGAFDQESIVEEWLENSGGPIVSIVNTRTGWTAQSYQLLNILYSLIKENVENIGMAWKNAMTGDVYFRKVLALIGDPLTRIWKVKPESLKVNYELTNTSIIFYIKDESGNSIKNARVTIFNDFDKKTDYTDSNGIAEIPLINEGKIKISVYHPDYYLYVDSIIKYNELKILSVYTDSDLKINKSFTLYLNLKNESKIPYYYLTIKADSAKGIKFKQSEIFINRIDPGKVLKIEALKGIITGENASFFLKIKTGAPFTEKKLFVNLPVIKDSFVIFGIKFSSIPHTYGVIDSLLLVNFSNHSRYLFIKIGNYSIPVDIERKSIKVLKNINVPLIGKKINVYAYENGKKIAERTFILDSEPDSFNVNIENIDIELNNVKIFLNSDIKFNSVVLLNTINKKYVYPEVFNKKIINLENISESFQAEILFTDINGNLMKKLVTDTINPILVYKTLEIPMEGYFAVNGRKIYGVSSPKSGDIDGDALNDIILPSQRGRIFILYGNSKIDTFEFENTYIEGTPVVFDIDGDGKDEFFMGRIYSTNYELLKFDNDSIEIKNGPSSTDISLSNNSYLYYYSGYQIHKTNYNLEEAPGFPVNAGGSVMGFSINDLYPQYESDEIVFVTWGAKVGIISSNGTLLNSIDLNGICEVAPVTADLNGDGELEIIVTTRDQGIYILNKSLEIIKHITQFSSLSQPIISNLEQDGTLEILNYARDGNLYKFDRNGNIKAIFYTEKQNSRISPLIADLFGDNKKEIIVITPDGYLYILNNNLQPLPGYPVYLGGFTNSTPLINDIDNDGKVELCVKAGGTFYILKLSDFRETPDWDEKYRDNRNTSSIRNNELISAKLNLKELISSANNIFSKKEKIIVFDVSGRRIATLKNIYNLYKESKLKRGIYFIKYEKNREKRSVKIVKLR